jgi:hypothetical protein
VRRADNLTTLCADCLEIWDPQPPGNLRACFAFTFTTVHSCYYHLINKELSCGIQHTQNSYGKFSFVLKKGLWVTLFNEKCAIQLKSGVEMNTISYKQR